MALFNDLQPWHWFVLGTAIFILEILGTGGFLLGIAVAAYIMGAFTYFTDNLSWQWQLILFAIDSVVLSFLYLKFFRGFNQTTDSPQLNDRAAQLIGVTFQLEDDISGQGSVQLGDTRWQVKCQGTIAAGGKVEVVGSEGMAIIIRAVSET